MPVAKPFTFHGAPSLNSSGTLRGELFTGFPLTAAADVTNVADWVTLGGTRKGQPPTPEQIALSRVNAARLWWCLHGVYLEAAGGLPWGSDGWAGLMPVQLDHSFGTAPDTADLEPADRMTESLVAQTRVDNFEALPLRVTRSMALRPCRMMANGEFVGFGIGAGAGYFLDLTVIVGNLDTSGRVANRRIGSWAEAPAPEWADYNSTLRVIDGIPFIEQSFFPTIIQSEDISWATTAIGEFTWWEFPD